ncbi:phytanoyl-CoA dioxygenase family protein [Paenibacillus allorhizosphaerae]|uniref:L-proline trans-4-hydroxylase n=1 Tax=Paenibacillus allorhizosphaerae TaxID=2849866 RepID=A0ABM8VG47_9BACL|nr:phytanoyl-CoA dioxygenase family protein [Paenibacillus allorhizosphaerae]CAG7637019.1 L-proline trans-4-hydroxylase [Paenibacillus allorhizosphaerae]
MLSYKQVMDYERDGYVTVEGVFSQEDVDKMIDAVENGDRVARTVMTGQADVSGKNSNLAIWHELGSDIWSAASTAPRVVNSVRILLGEDAAFFHGKVMLKEARTGGAWEWHQDYGYWYNQGFIFPNMISAFVALDEATIENGCLQVLRGSHLLGRLDHGKVGSQVGVEPRRLAQVESMFERVHCELKPGSVLFFHSNLLHASAANESERHRRSFIMCYTAVSNPQITKNGTVWRTSCPISAEGAILA